ncbi:thioredoxin-like protein [Zopfochytrium polystomum]|nr:thioredoxin-like protein [Zopfochytrium polystomum]
MAEPNPPSPIADKDLNEDDLFAELERDDDDTFSHFREKRMAEVKEEMRKVREMAENLHGTYQEILSEKEILTITTTEEKCVVHFFHKEFRRCQIMDTHISTLAAKHFRTRFVKIDVDNCPFLVTKLHIQVLPCVISFVKGISVDRIVGFEELGQSDAFQTTLLERRMAQSNVINIAPPQDERNTRKTIFGFADSSKSDDDDVDD